MNSVVEACAAYTVPRSSALQNAKFPQIPLLKILDPSSTTCLPKNQNYGEILLNISMEGPGRFFPFLHLPIEIRTEVYRNILVSKLHYGPRNDLWRPIAVDDGIFKIGLFEKDAVLPLLLANRQVHAEAVVILYGENTFIFRVSGFADGPLTFLDRLPPRYVRLLRRVYIRTGYYVCNPPDRYAKFSAPTVRKAIVQSRRDLAISIALVRQSWPMNYKNIHIDSDSAGLCAEPRIRERIKQLRGFHGFEEWLAAAWYFWEMVTTEPDAEEPRKEFRCIDWETSTPIWKIKKPADDGDT